MFNRNNFHQELRAMGWSIVRQSRHLIWRHPNAASLVTTAVTASDHRATKNILSLAKRLVRQGRPT